MKKVYTIYRTPQANGAYFYAADYDDSYPTAYPQTDVAIPDSLKDGLPRFSWADNSWYDASEDGTAKILSDLTKDNTQLKAYLQAATNMAEQNKQSVSGLQSALDNANATISTQIQQLANQSILLSTQEAKITTLSSQLATLVMQSANTDSTKNPTEAK